MNPEELLDIINAALAPYRKGIEDLDSVVKRIMGEVAQLLKDSAVSKQEIKTFVTERMSTIHLELLRDRDAFRGDPGEKGDQGGTGLRGDRGERGLTGDQGEAGETGDQGEAGGTGETGLKGDRGDQGDQGDRGEKGITGDRGDPGRDGALGEKGVSGDQGIPGTHGDRGEKGDRGDVGQTGETGETGKTGPTGLVGSISEWQKRTHSSGEIVTHGGATWQCRRKTLGEPGRLSNSWELLTNGISTGEFSEDHRLSVVLANGDVIKSQSLRGDKGEKGNSVTLHLKYNVTHKYRAGIDEVKESGAVWRAVKTGLLHKPGSAKGKGQWVNITHRGPAGPAGKDADPKAIGDAVFGRVMLSTKAMIEGSIALTDTYFESADFNV